MTEIPHQPEIIDLTALSDSSGLDEEDRNLRGADDDEGSVSEGSETSEIEITLNEETRAELETAIATVSEARLRQLLNVLVETDITIEAALTRELVTLKRGTQQIAPRWETCSNCDEEYDINVVRGGAECIFHPGELEVHEESFVDWDENVHGPMDSLENRREYPENFLWSCCEKDGNTVGCVQGEHRPAVPRKRKRLEE